MSANEKMNVLVIFSDQQHKFAFGKRNSQFITPNLDKLCDDGVCFTEAYSNNPVCGPFRGCLMTGQLPSHCGVLGNADPLPDDAQTLATAMQNAGYSTGYVGKYHLGGMGNIPTEAKQRRGFEKFMGYQCYNGFNPEPPFNNEVVFFDENDNRHEYNLHRTDVTTNLACDMLDEFQGKEKSFFMMVSYQAPHYPEQPSKKYEQIYKNTVFNLDVDYQETDPYTPTQSPPSVKPKENDPDYKRYGGNIQEYLRLYAALCTQVDAGVGKIIEKLKASGEYENTLIIYTSDHGDMQGSRGINNKCVAYEKSAGIPMIIRLPNGRKGETSDKLVSGIDIYPTAIEIANAKTTQMLDGVSLVDYLNNKTDETQEYIISELCMDLHQWRMIRKGNYKLVCEIDYTKRELFDLSIDPLEQNNLCNDANQQSNLKDLTELLKSKTSEIMKQANQSAGNT